MARYLQNALVAACIVSVAVSIPSRSHLDQKKNMKRQYNGDTTGFPCDNGQYVFSSSKCDGFDDCGDNSDEENCLGYTDYPCINGDVIPYLPIEYVCDMYNDCIDGTDEVGCPYNSYSASSPPPGNSYSTSSPDTTGFPCDNGQYVVWSWKCDGFDDCGDNSDEENCLVDSYSGPDPDTSTTTFDDCYCTCQNTGYMPAKKSFKASVSNGLSKHKEGRPKPSLAKKSQNAMKYLQLLSRSLKAKQLKKERK